MNFLSAIKESDAFFSTLSTFLIELIAGMNAEQPFFSWECLKYRYFQSFNEVFCLGFFFKEIKPHYARHCKSPFDFKILSVPDFTEAQAMSAVLSVATPGKSLKS